MATEIEELIVKLQADTANFRAEMKAAVTSVDTSTSKMAKDFESFSKTSAKNTSSLSQALSTMAGVLASDVIKGGISFLKNQFVALTEAFKQGIDDANAEEVAITKLAASLAISGNYTKAATEDFRAFASQLEETTGISDDAVISSGALISTLTKLSGAPLKDATLAAADLSAQFGIDLTAASTAVGKALNGQTGALERYGIQVRVGATEAETMANVMKALEGSVGGAAEKLGNTFAGSQAKASNAVKNLNEELAKSVQGNVTIVAVFNEVAKIFNENTKNAEENRKSLRVFVGEGVVFAIEAVRTFIAILDSLRAVWEAVTATTFTAINLIVASLKTLIEVLATVGKAAFQLATGDFTSAFDTIADGFKNAQNIGREFASDTISAYKDVGAQSETLLKIDSAFGRIETAARAGLEATKAGAEAAVEPLNQASDATRKLAEENMKLVEAITERAEVAQLAAEKGIEIEAAQAEIDYEGQQAALDEALAAKRLSLEQYYANVDLLASEYAAKLDATNQKQADNAKKIEESKAAAVKGTLESLASFQGSKSKELAAIGKAAAIAQALVNTYSAANLALASSPPPFNFIQAAAVTAAGIANVAKISSTPLATGIDSVPGIGNRDNFPAILAPGERVVPRETNKDLKEFLDNGSGGGGVNVTISIQGDYFESPDGDVRLLERIQRGILQTGFKLNTT